MKENDDNIRTVRILTIEDHEMTAVGYKSILEAENFGDFKVRVDIITDYNKGKEKIESSSRTLHYDIILMDIQLFPSHSKEMKSGEDLGLLAKRIVPESKLVFMSSFGDSLRITSIFKNVKPDGYMVKSEIDEQSLKTMVQTIIDDKPYCTAGAFTAMLKKITSDIAIDDIDQKILYHLSTGTRTKDIAPLISISTTTVESRKRHLKIIFGTENGNDISLIEAAREKGFL